MSLSSQKICVDPRAQIKLKCVRKLENMVNSNVLRKLENMVEKGSNFSGLRPDPEKERVSAHVVGYADSPAIH